MCLWLGGGWSARCPRASLQTADITVTSEEPGRCYITDSGPGRVSSGCFQLSVSADVFPQRLFHRCKDRALIFDKTSMFSFQPVALKQFAEARWQKDYWRLHTDSFHQTHAVASPEIFNSEGKYDFVHSLEKKEVTPQKVTIKLGDPFSKREAAQRSRELKWKLINLNHQPFW